MKFQLLGPVVARSDGAALPLGPAKQRSLLAALLLDPGRVVPIENLITALWDDAAPASAVSNVRTYASRLRAALVDGQRVTRLVGRNPGYVIHVDDGELDVAVFRDLANAGHAAIAAGQPNRAAKSFHEALALWRGSAAEDVFRSTYLERRLTAIEEQRLAIVEEWVSARQQLREDAELIAHLRRFTGSYPLRERLWCQLILSLYRVGDIGGALAAYQRARTIVIEDLGVDPGPELVRLHRAILARDPALGGPNPYGVPEQRRPAVTLAPPPPAATPVADPATVAWGANPPPAAYRPAAGLAPEWMTTPRELPGVAATLIGRDRPLATIVETATERCRGEYRRPTATDPTVIAVYGPRGVGKSALAIRAATALVPLFPDGQMYADLRGAGERPGTAEILGRFLRALGVPDAHVPTGAAEAAARYRSIAVNRRLLVVLDNADDEAQIRPLLTAARGSAVIVTSERKLAALDCTAHVEVEPLGDADAGLLLADLGHIDRRSWDRAALRPLVELCAGLPLALRIVAARIASAPGRPPAVVTAELIAERRRHDGLSFGDLRITFDRAPAAA